MGETNEKVRARVFRFDPEKDKEPHFDNFEVPYIQRMSVLGVLMYIYENLDRSLAFYCSCRIGRCYGCNVRMNGKTVLACRALALKEMTIEPPPRVPIIRDLLTRSEKKSEYEEASSSE